MKTEEGVKDTSRDIDTAVDDPNQDDKKSVPYSRFSEVIHERNDYRDKFEEIYSKSQELETALNERESLINRIRGLAADERVAKHVFAIDNALQGKWDELEDMIEELEEEDEDKDIKVSDSDSDKKQVKKTIKRESDIQKLKEDLRKQKTEIEDRLAYQNAVQVFELARDRASRYLDALPEDFTKEDREVLAEMWNNRMDWDAVDQNNGVLDQELARSFEQTLIDYGEPRGAVRKAVEAGLEANKQDDEPELTDEELINALKTVDFSKRKEDGSLEIDDDDFSSYLADVMRVTRK